MRLADSCEVVYDTAPGVRLRVSARTLRKIALAISRTAIVPGSDELPELAS